MGMISRRGRILSYTVQQVIPNICTPNFQILGSVVPEKSDEKKSSHTHTITEKTKTIYPLYTLYTKVITRESSIRKISVREQLSKK